MSVFVSHTVCASMSARTTDADISKISKIRKTQLITEGEYKGEVRAMNQSERVNRLHQKVSSRFQRNRRDGQKDVLELIAKDNKTKEYVINFQRPHTR